MNARGAQTRMLILLFALCSAYGVGYASAGAMWRNCDAAARGIRATGRSVAHVMRGCSPNPGGRLLRIEMGFVGRD